MGQGPGKVDKAGLIDCLKQEGAIRSDAVKKAFEMVRREDFLPPEQKGMAYCDTPLSILAGQTISAPSMIAVMLEESKLKQGLKVLEIGAGSGYNAALLAEIVGPENVVTVERLSDLVTFASVNLEKSGYAKVRVVKGDGSLGYEKEAPYDRVIVTAASPKISRFWVDQLKPNGLIVAPVGGRHFSQDLIVARKNRDGEVTETYKCGCIFVPLIGREGFQDY